MSKEESIFREHCRNCGKRLKKTWWFCDDDCKKEWKENGEHDYDHELENTVPCDRACDHAKDLKKENRSLTMFNDYLNQHHKRFTEQPYRIRYLIAIDKKGNPKLWLSFRIGQLEDKQKEISESKEYKSIKLHYIDISPPEWCIDSSWYVCPKCGFKSADYEGNCLNC
jgi:hypothetical protein